MSPDLIVIRHACPGVPHFLARNLKAGVVNAGDGAHEHPTQALLDALTIRRRFGRLEGLRVAIAGDIAHSRVVRSNIWLLTKMGASVVVCAPPTLLPPRIEEMGVEGDDGLRRGARGGRRRHDAPHAARAAGRVALPVHARVLQALRADGGAAGARRPEAVVMHPGPMNRGVEIASDVADFAPLAHPRAGLQRRRRPDGRALSAPDRPRLGGGSMSRALLLRGGRLVDPPAGVDGELDLLIRDGLVAGAGRGPVRRRRRGARCVGSPRAPRFHRPPRAPSRTGPRICGDDRDRPEGGRGGRLHGRLCDAEHGPGRRQPADRRVRGEQGPGGGGNAPLHHRSHHEGAGGKRAGRVRRAASRRRGRGLRRRQVARRRRSPAAGLRARAPLRDARRAALRGSDPLGGRADARGSRLDAPRALGSARDRRVRGHRAGPPGGRDLPRAPSRGASLDGAVARARRGRQGSRSRRDVRR